ncbi:hypothetical protein L596_026249 [Steinernema carpocapsae]|uniref:TAFII28-like protein domain-containing protein n=1 Tax=Steinernema carpocapsae TaxID=34508 RepID=A0A4U5M0W9_STECR|nr:hypothetical protein L596_026249 [Steinernema carpocapsae]
MAADLPEEKRKVLESKYSRMQWLLGNFTQEQLEKYEIYRRTTCPKNKIRRFIEKQCNGMQPSPDVVLAIASLAKTFLCELAEEALDIKESDPAEEKKPMEPKHLHRAFQQLLCKGKLYPMPGSRKNPFDGF